MGTPERDSLKQRRVAIVQEYVPSYRAPFFRALRQDLDARGIALIVAAGEPGPRAAARRDADASQVDVHLRQREVAVRSKRLTLRLLPRQVRTADLIIVEQARRNLDTYLLLLSASRLGKVALWGHGVDMSHQPGRVRARLLRWLTKRADGIFVYTEAGRRRLMADGYDSGQVTVVRNTTDTGALVSAIAALADSEVDAWRSQLSLGSGPIFSFVGALDRAKGVGMLAEAWEIVHRRRPDARLLIGGEGEDRDCLLVSGAPMPGVRLLGHVGNREKAFLFRESHALVVPGQVGLVAVECLATGLPLITVAEANHGPEFAYLQPGEDVFIAAGITPAAIAQSMLDRVNEGRKRPDPGAASDWSIEQMAQRFSGGVVELVGSQ